jgi:prepilin-type N-terminal cleavage/methylation domain-containing protein
MVRPTEDASVLDPWKVRYGCFRSQLAFTLVELLVVIALVAVLASLLLPALAHAKGAGQSARCKSNLRQWGAAMLMFVDDFRAYPHRLGFADSIESAAYRTPLTESPEWGPWFQALGYHYLKRELTGRPEGSVYSCPTVRLPRERLSSLDLLHYGYNGAGSGVVNQFGLYGLGGKAEFHDKGRSHAGC